MDLYSGSYPLKVIPFHLDMSNEDLMTESTNPVVALDNEEQKKTQDKNEQEKDVRHESQASNLSCSTEESNTAFIERTVSNFPTPHLEHPVQATGESFPEITKTSESEPVMVTVSQLPNVARQDAEKTQSETPDNRGLFYDASYPGDIFDNSGVDLITAKPSTFTLDSDVLSWPWRRTAPLVWE